MPGARRLAGALALGLFLATPSTAVAEGSGVVFEDVDRDGVRDAEERGLEGVVLSDGRQVVRTDAAGRYRLPEREGFVRLTCPDDFECPAWFARGAADFALVPAPSPDEFFFIQISDAHVFEDIRDFQAFSMPLPAWLPQSVTAWLTLRFLVQISGLADADEVAARLRQAVAPYRNVGESSDLEVVSEYFAEVFEPGSELGRVGKLARAAVAEVAALRPAFVVSTGDLVLEGNNSSPEAIERWFLFYEEITGATGLRFYNTIGNNEIAGNSNDDFSPDDPRYGKHFFRAFYGPTHYSFDHGPYHFVALDTHRPAPSFFRPKWWDYGRMEDDVRDWLDADLAAHRGRVLVVLNHEPFHDDASWGFDYEPASDDGLFAKHSVDWVLAGHIHRNGSGRSGTTRHVTTGALSGGRWVAPANVNERGYRLFYARDGQLYHAWKRLGEPLVELILADGGAPDEIEVIGVAADRDGPFTGVEVRLDGAPLVLEPWGDYFVRVRLDPGALERDPAQLELHAIAADGRVERAELSIRRSPPRADAGDR